MRKAGIGIALLCVAALVWWWTRDDASARRTRADTVRHGAARDATARDDRHDPPAAEQAKDEEESKEGIDVTVAVHFRDGRPAAGVEVTLKRYRKLVGQTTTDSAGMATFPDRTETYLLAHVGSAAVAVLRPREDPKGVMTLPETKRVRIAVFCDGTRQVPDGLLIPELFGLQVDRSAAVVSGFTVRKANVGLPQGVRGPQTQFTLTAPGYRPVQVVVKGDPLGGEARLVRGVHTVLTVPGLRTPPY
ncbi:MAG: hypothetical protein OER88_09765, partial [Planctomycetota bacterium]|nr:hypothetical protein [Planctomycetota bacterium]